MLSWQLTNALVALLLPPGMLILLMAGGLALRRTRPRLATGLITGSLVALYVLSMPLTAHFLLTCWEPPPSSAGTGKAAAIVVLGGGKSHDAPEYGGDTVRGATLLRLRYAAHLQRRTGLPILVSGGSPEGSAPSEADLMRRALQNEFSVPVRWAEDGSANTLENARLSYRMLAAENIRSVYLVTHAWHMPRARLAFETAGFQVIPAATGYTTRYRLTILDVLPSALALRDSALFFHEIIGIVWYRLRLILRG
ncbi:MAG: YdcF family protein [Burkholderiales bacterium]|nr:YdcF family protein [Burkholderiales bacterium]